MDTLQFLDGNGDKYQFYFGVDEFDQEHYVEITRYYTPSCGRGLGWIRYARQAFPATRTIEWDISGGTVTSKTAQQYIEKVYKNKAFL